MKRKLIAAALALYAAQAGAVLVCTSADPHYDDGDDGAFTDVVIMYASWKVGSPAPSLDVGAEQIVTCAANGAELAYIAAHFSGLPMRSNAAGRTVVWRGDAAVFILDNL
jgi:hypothetical protein